MTFAPERSTEGTAGLVEGAPARGGTLADMPYESFLAERTRIVEARQRAQQRFDQIVTTGAAGALVMSITFLEALAPTPAPETQSLLLSAWGFLLLTLGFNFAGHFSSQFGFTAYLRNFDAAFQSGSPCDHQSAYSKAAHALDMASAVTFVAGIVLLAVFSFSNVQFRSQPPNDIPSIVAPGSAESPR